MVFDPTTGGTVHNPEEPTLGIRIARWTGTFVGVVICVFVAILVALIALAGLLAVWGTLVRMVS
jgi:hypothetical protein